MADIKISQLSEAQLVSGTDVFPMTSNGVTMKASASALKDYTIGTTGNSDLGADVSTQIYNLHGQVSNNDDAYSELKDYAVGDLCIHDNVLYRCITPCSAGSWTVNQSCFVVDTLTNATTKRAPLSMFSINAAGMDLNDLTLPGQMFYAPNSTLNLPNTQAGNGINIGLSVRLCQIFITRNNHIYQRNLTDGVWGTWETII